MLTINSIDHLIVALLALLCTFNQALASGTAPDEEVVVPTGGERALNSDDFRPHRPSGSAYNEIWSYTFLLNDGMQATFSLSQAYLGSLMAPVSGAEFSISGFHGETYRAPKEFDAEDMVYTPSTGRIQISPRIYVEGILPRQHSIHFGAWKNEIEYEVVLTLSDIAPGLTWGDGIFRVGQEYVGIFMHIPYAKVRGEVTIGGVTKQVVGTAYMDHTLQSNFAPKIARSAYRYVQHEGAKEVGFVIMPNERYENRVIGLGAVQEGGRFRLRKPEAMQVVSTRQIAGVEVPHQLAVRYAREGQTIINRERDQQVFSVLEDLGGLQRAVVKRFIGGEVVVFRGRGTTNRRGRLVYDYLLVK